MHMPPPIHGAAQVGQYIHDSKLINESFECRYFNPSASSSVKQVGQLNFQKIAFLFTSLWKIRSIVKDFKPDLVYITPSSWDWGFYRDFLTIWMLKRYGCRVVAHFHNKAKQSFLHRWYNRELYKHFFSNIKTIFLAPTLTADFKTYLSQSQIYICPNGIDAPLETTTQNEGSNSWKETRFLFLSNMMKEKGVWELIEACRRLRGKNFTCTFVGKWSDVTEDEFKQKVHDYHLEEKVFAVGGKYGEEKIPYFQNSDCFVFPTFYHGECFPLVLLEAMSYGLPCISANEGGISDLLDDGINGIIVERHNVDALAEAMNRIIDNPKTAKEMGTNAYNKFRKNYTLDVFEKNILYILQDCIKQ